MSLERGHDLHFLHYALCTIIIKHKKKFFLKKSHCVGIIHMCVFCHPGSVGGGYLFVSRVFNPLDYSYGGEAAMVVSAKGEVAAG